MKIRSLTSPVVLCGLLLTLSACGGGADQEADTSATTSASQQADDSPANRAPIDVEEGVVPNVTGYPLHETILALRDGSLRYEVEGGGFDSEKDSKSTREWTVTEQSPAAGAEIDPRGTVRLTVERND